MGAESLGWEIMYKKQPLCLLQQCLKALQMGSCCAAGQCHQCPAPAGEAQTTAESVSELQHEANPTFLPGPLIFLLFSLLSLLWLLISEH